MIFVSREAVQAALQSDLPTPAIEMIRQAPKHPEGRAIRLAVKSAANARCAKKLLAIKLGA